jgi:hypothetical protein
MTLLVIAGVYLLARETLALDEDEAARKWNAGLPPQHESVWLVHDAFRPKPPIVAPAGVPGGAPSDALVLFDGSDLSQWEPAGRGLWDVREGAMEVNGRGSIRTKQKFGDCQLHLEYRAPTPPQKSDQGRGNSGIIFCEHYEVQVLDNHENPTYADGYIGAVYGQHPPLVNVCRKPGEWQTYDIVFRAPRWKGKDLLEPGRVTVFLNGVLVQHDAKIHGRVAWRELAKYTAPDEKHLRGAVEIGKLLLQDHGDGQHPQFRNIWIREIDLSPEAIDQRAAKR